MNKFVFLILLIFSAEIKAGSISDLCKEQDLGWNFYCDDKKPKKIKPKKKNPPKQENILDRLEKDKKIVEEALVTAIYYPSEENVIKYLLLNKKQLAMSEKFGFATKKAILNHPYLLDPTLENPENTLARRLKYKEERATKISLVKNLNDKYGIYFFYLSTCAACHAYSPILKEFSKIYGVNVLPVSADGGALPEWQDFVVDRGQIAKLGIKVFPTTVLFDINSKKMMHIGTGIVSHDELLDNIFMQVGDV